MDLFDVLDAQARVKAGESLDALNVNVMSHTTDAEGFRKFSQELSQRAGFKPADKPAFDEDGFLRLREQMRLGRM